jgi:hypothetical protein
MSGMTAPSGARDNFFSFHRANAALRLGLPRITDALRIAQLERPDNNPTFAATLPPTAQHQNWRVRLVWPVCNTSVNRCSEYIDLI